jgi:hypothetical protein
MKWKSFITFKIFLPNSLNPIIWSGGTTMVIYLSVLSPFEGRITLAQPTRQQRIQILM